MDPRSLKYLAEKCDGELVAGNPDSLALRAGSDSRSARAGDLFFALSGENFDGHAFVQSVAAGGVTGVVVNREKVPKNLNCGVIAVDSPRGALGRLAANYRQEFDLPVVAVGGSNGKTTTKELLASVLRQKFTTIWSEASFNNDIGVPMTLLRLGKNAQAAVLEVGTNHPGELGPLVEMVKPTLGVITSIGREHLEFFHDLAGVIAEEGQLAEKLPAGGKLFLNGDGAGILEIARRCPASVVKVGLNAGNRWRASKLAMNEHGTHFEVETDVAGFSGSYQIQLLGRHQVVNSLFAIAVGAELGLSQEQIRRGLNECKTAKMRLESWVWNGVCVLDDAYNANADSMLAALETLQQMNCIGRRVAILGDMAELGAQSENAHQEIGRQTVSLGVDQLFTLGKLGGVLAQAARTAGLKSVCDYAEISELATALKEFLQPGDVVLFKASRSMRLERVTDLFKSPKPAVN